MIKAKFRKILKIMEKNIKNFLELKKCCIFAA